MQSMTRRWRRYVVSLATAVVATVGSAAAEASTIELDIDSVLPYLEARKDASGNPAGLRAVPRLRMLVSDLQGTPQPTVRDLGQALVEYYARVQHLVSALDKNGDGVLSRAEVQQAGPTLLAAFAKIDADRNDRLTVDELLNADLYLMFSESENAVPRGKRTHSGDSPELRPTGAEVLAVVEFGTSKAVRRAKNGDPEKITIVATPINEVRYTFVYDVESPEGDIMRGPGGLSVKEIANRVSKFMWSFCKKSGEDCAQYANRVMGQCFKAFSYAMSHCEQVGGDMLAACSTSESLVPSCGN